MWCGTLALKREFFMCGPRPGRVRCRLSQTRPGDHNKGWYPDIGGWVARCGRGFSGFSGAPPGAQISASRRASAPTRRATRARGGGGWDRRLVQLSNDGLGRVISQILASGWRKRCPGMWVQKKCVLFGILVVKSHTKPAFWQFSHFSHFVTGGSKGPGNPGLCAAIRTAARARSGRANDMGGIRE
eukprot:gene18399-biopygen5418